MALPSSSCQPSSWPLLRQCSAYGPHLSGQPGQPFGFCSGGIGGGLYLGGEELGLLGHQLPGFFSVGLDAAVPLG